MRTKKINPIQLATEIIAEINNKPCKLWRQCGYHIKPQQCKPTLDFPRCPRLKYRKVLNENI